MKTKLYITIRCCNVLNVHLLPSTDQSESSKITFYSPLLKHICILEIGNFGALSSFHEKHDKVYVELCICWKTCTMHMQPRCSVFAVYAYVYLQYILCICWKHEKVCWKKEFMVPSHYQCTACSMYIIQCVLHDTVCL